MADDGIFSRLGRLWDKVTDPVLIAVDSKLEKAKVALADAIPDGAAFLRKNAAEDRADMKMRQEKKTSKTSHALGLDSVLSAMDSELAKTKLALADAMPGAATFLRQNAAKDKADIEMRRGKSRAHVETVHDASKPPATPSVPRNGRGPQLRDI